jgi:hypothetical protein
MEDNLSDMENIADGGAALTAYAKLQYVYDHQRTWRNHSRTT